MIANTPRGELMTLHKTREELITEVEALRHEVITLRQLVRSPAGMVINGTNPLSCQKTQEYTIVLVVDSAVERDIYRKHLINCHHHQVKIIEFDRGQDALAWRQQIIPDILLVDFSLPDLNGLEFLQRLYQVTHHNWIPAIIITDQENADLAIDLLKNGAQDCLVKNQITATSLQQAIAKILRQQQFIQEQVWQQQQQQLVTKTALSIRNSLKLADILHMAVTEIREILQSDRVIIYQFQADWSGIITTEAIVDPSLSIIGQTINDDCFPTWIEQYLQGRIRAIDDVCTETELAECYREFLTHLQIRANLVIPIIQSDHLWGLLIAHECYAPRTWTNAECELMNQLAIQLGIAIQQANLFEKLQTQLIQYQQLVSIVENSSDFIATANLTGQLQYINPAGQHLLGLENIDVQQINLCEYQTLETSQIFQETIIPTVISTGTWEGELEIRHLYTGEIIPVWCNIFTLKDSRTNQPYTIATVTRDIREQKQAALVLKQLNSELELRVAQRTVQLIQANNKLQQELFQREKLERELRQREKLLDGFFHAASQVNIGLSILDKNFCFLKINQVLADYDGYPITKYLGQSFENLLPEIAPRILPVLQSVIDTKQPISNMEVSGVVPSQPGVIRYWLVSYFPILGEFTDAISLGAIVLEISDRKRLEIERERQVAILEATSDFVATAKFDTQKIESFNKASRRFFGIPDGTTFDELTISDFHPQWALNIIQEEAIPTAVKNGIWVGETAFLRHDGQEVPVSQAIIVHNYGTNHVQSLSTIARDITAQKQIEAQLRESDRRWRSLQDNIQLIVICLDRQGHVEYANPYFLQLTGYTSTEVIGKNWFDNFLPQHLRHLKEIYLQYLIAKKLPPHYCNGILNKSGEERIINWNNTILEDINGHPIGAFSIGEDITESYKLERMKAEFVAIVSHELRTPLTSMQASLSLLHEKIIDPSSSEGEAIIEIANHGVEHLVRLVNDILDLEHLASGKIHLKKCLFNTGKLIKNAIEQIQGMAKQTGVYISSTDADYQIYADPDRLLQVMINLLSNAIKFSADGSTIWLDCHIYQQLSDRDITRTLNSSIDDVNITYQPFLVFTVKDTGRGIPRDYLNKIFEPFEQVDTSDSRTKGGTGLGLTICRSIIQQHGGHIWVESVLEQGSTFYFTLPIGEINSA